MQTTTTMTYDEAIAAAQVFQATSRALFELNNEFSVYADAHGVDAIGPDMMGRWDAAVAAEESAYTLAARAADSAGTTIRQALIMARRG